MKRWPCVKEAHLRSARAAAPLLSFVEVSIDQTEAGATLFNTAPERLLRDARRRRTCYKRAAYTATARPHRGPAAAARLAALRHRSRCHLPRAPRPPSGVCPSAGGVFSHSAARTRVPLCPLLRCGVSAPQLTRLA
jgi:hypothetical protein